MTTLHTAVRTRALAPALLRGALVVALMSVGAAVLPTPALAADEVLWDGGFETGGLPYGSITGGGTTDSAYSSIQQQGGAGESEIVTDHQRSADSARALKIVMPPYTQREQPTSTYAWYPDADGTVDHWYGFSIYYDQDWNLGGGIAKEVSGSSWHNPVAWRMQGDNGSLNISGDLVDGQPRMMLRRNTVKDKEGFYTDGLGLDKIDAGPVVVGKWMDFVVHIRWSTTSRNALREVWRDGVLMGRSTSLNAVGTAKHVLRVGQYQDTNIAHTRTSYYDNVRIGTSYAAVDPARRTTASIVQQPEPVESSPAPAATPTTATAEPTPFVGPTASATPEPAPTSDSLTTTTPVLSTTTTPSPTTAPNKKSRGIMTPKERAHRLRG